MSKCKNKYVECNVKVLFIYKDSNGIVGDIIVNISKRDNELAIATFEKAFPNVVWREFSYQ